MSLNKTLCKWFDNDKNGYVTIGDVGRTIIAFMILITGGFVALYALYQSIILIYNIIYSIDAPSTLVNEINTFLGVIGLIFFGIIGVVIITSTLEYISTIKIAECELKDKDSDK